MCSIIRPLSVSGLLQHNNVLLNNLTDYLDEAGNITAPTSFFPPLFLSLKTAAVERI